jgi:MscS family membrane protein
MLVPIVRKSLRVTVVLFAVVSIAQSLSDKPISALIAGLGLGGLAFALAAQDTIKNLFGSLVIFSDKPFGLGDRINYDGHDGTIEEVGLRSTRLRRLDGHQVTIPNGELANKSIHNIAKRPFIRRIFTIGVTYDTSPEKVKEAKAILEDILKDHEGLDPKGELLPRVYFSDFSASSLDFKCMYWYHPPAYWDYMDFSERVNMEILQRFNEAGIEFAFPTQTIHLAKEETSLNS